MVATQEVIDLAVSVSDAVEDLESPAERVLALVRDTVHALGGLVQDTDWQSGTTRLLSSGYEPAAVEQIEQIEQVSATRREAGPFTLTHARGDLAPATAQQVMGGWLTWCGSAHRSFRHEDTGRSQMFTVGIRGGPDVVALCLVRDGADLGPPQSGLLAEIQPLLAAMDRHLRRMETSRASLPASPEPPGDSVRSAGLTSRETEALLLLSQGLTAAAAARRMSCSVSMVNKHLGNLYRKLGVTDRLEAVLEAQRRRLLTVTQPPAAQAFAGGQGAKPSTDAALVVAR